MPESALPYVLATGNVAKVLNKIKTAQAPPRFTQDFLESKLSMKGGSARAVIPFLKRIGLLGSDGVPTDLYHQFRNSAQSGAAAAQALRTGYRPLYEANEYAHDATDKDLLGLVVQITGLADDSRAARGIVATFKALKDFADFTERLAEEDEPPADEEEQGGRDEQTAGEGAGGIKLGYVINLNLPATSDAAVFNAIFKSLREHLL